MPAFCRPAQACWTISVSTEIEPLTSTGHFVLQRLGAQAGKYPKILDRCPKWWVKPRRASCSPNGRAHPASSIIEEELHDRARGVRLLAGQPGAMDDDIVVFADASRERELLRLHHALRQQIGE